MNSCDDIIAKAKKELPELCRPKDLIQFGLFTSEQSIHYARKHGYTSEYFKLPHGAIVYPKAGIIQMLEKSKRPGIIHEDNNTGRPYTKSESKSHKKGLRL